MALPPDSGDTFLREVDENLRRDQMRDFGKKYGGWLIGGVVLFLAAVGGWLYWQDRQRAEAAEDSEALAQIYTDIGTNKMATVPQRLDTLSNEGGDVVRASALFARAAIAIEQNDRKLAAAKYHEIAADEDAMGRVDCDGANDAARSAADGEIGGRIDRAGGAVEAREAVAGDVAADGGEIAADDDLAIGGLDRDRVDRGGAAAGEGAESEGGGRAVGCALVR